MSDAERALALVQTEAEKAQDRGDAGLARELARLAWREKRRQIDAK